MRHRRPWTLPDMERELHHAHPAAVTAALWLLLVTVGAAATAVIR